MQYLILSDIVSGSKSIVQTKEMLQEFVNTQTNSKQCTII